jgi:hypothetical protein
VIGAGWVKMPRWIVEAAASGRLTAVEQHVLLNLWLIADSHTGVASASAPYLVWLLGFGSKHPPQAALDELERKGYILRAYVPRQKGNYLVLLDKYQITQGPNCDEFIDLEATNNRFGITIDQLDSKIRAKYITQWQRRWLPP